MTSRPAGSLLAWKDLRVSTKLAVGFGLTSLLAAALGGWTLHSLDRLEDSSQRASDVARLRTEMVEREIDHLHWATKVNSLWTDANSSTLDLQTRAHQCDLGRWLYSSQRQKAEQLVAELKPLLAQLEEPHERLHESAEQIRMALCREPPELRLTMAQQWSDQLAWVEQCGRRLANECATLGHQKQLRNAVHQALSVIAAFDQESSRGEVPARKRQALDAIKAMRFGPEGKGYLWINDTVPQVVLHPLTPSLNGQDLAGHVDPHGKRLFVEMVNLCREKGEGFVTYSWAREPGGTPVAWLSYVKLYKPWNWIVGTSLAIDDSDKVLLARADELAAGRPFTLGLEADATRCGLGRFLSDAKTVELGRQFPEFAASLDRCRPVHERLHQLARKIEELVNEAKPDAAVQVYNGEVQSSLAELKTCFDAIAAAESARRERAAKAKEIYATVTLPNLTKLQEILDAIQKEIDRQGVAEAPLPAMVSDLRRTVLSLTLAALAASIVLAVAIGKSLARPLHRCAESLRALARQEFDKRCDLQRGDELGQVADAINESIAATQKALDALQETRRNERQGYEERLAGTERRAEAEREKVGEAEAKIRQLQETLALEKQKAEEQAAGAAEWERWQAEALRRKVDRLLVAVAAAGKGDLTQTIEVDGDEPIDELAGALTQMLADLSGLIGQVAKSASRFTDSSRVIAERSQTLALGVQTQSAGVAQMNVSVEELARSIAVVKTSAGEAHAVAKQTNALAEQGGQSVRRSIDAMEQLRHSSKQINEITQVIAEIARQTNLLSLNAAIEAARAGEHGMGFAVVADEVRKLAARTDQAANQIAKLLQDSVQQIEAGAQLSVETGEALQQILQGVDATARQIAAIATTTAQQAASAQEASTAIHSVALVTEQTAAGSEQMASRSEELGREAETLRGLIHCFRTE